MQATQIDTTAIGKLLLNSWSAEYALRVPIADKTLYRETGLTWTFPHAYYAACFSARAVLFCKGHFTANPHEIASAMNRLAEEGFYSRDYAFTQYNNPYRDLATHRITGEKALTLPTSVFLPDYHQGLIDKVQAISLLHEGYVLYHVGVDIYAEIIARTPVYLQSGFVADRFATLTAMPV